MLRKTINKYVISKEARVRNSLLESPVGDFSLPLEMTEVSPLNNFHLKKIALLFVVLMIALSSCASNNKHHKKLKRGKPIPCPTKDC